ncbi:hypothetical protein ACFV1L_20430 [Kitasatospora sp. NPDC059646]|uniref:hypothetical protein n=1 Tax=Kitasatospora sp. NPDC059646 TaxID=3346893 RepID=UPI0036A22374
MSSDRENETAETEAVLSLQEAPAAEEDDVQAHGASTLTITCNVTVTKTIVVDE